MQSNSMIAPRLSAMMFLQFFVWGAWYVTVGNYMAVHDMADSIGNAYTVGPIAAILSPFFLGLVADRLFSTERVLAVLHVLGGAVMCAAPHVEPELFVPLLLAHMLCYMPTLGLTNTLTFHNITDQEKQFPIIRVFGTIGWIVAGVIVSKVLGADEKPIQFYVAGGSGILLGLYSLTLPHTPPPMKGKNVSIGELLGVGSLRLMAQPSFAVFMISSFLICIPLAAYYAYAPVFVGQAGIENPGFKMSFGQVSEIFFMLVMPLCFRRLGVKWMLLVGMFAWVLRYALFAAGAPDGILWMIMGGIILHGICYDFFFVTGQIYVDKTADVSIRGQAQGFLVLVTQGAGMLIGAQISQKIFNDKVTGEGPALLASWKEFWMLPCIAAAVIMVAFFLLFRDNVTADESPDSPSSPEAADPAE
jgi:nucleoside transporter